MYANNSITIHNPHHVPIELSCCLDTDLAQMYFDENFVSISGDRLFLYTDNGNLPDEPPIVKISTTKNSMNTLAKALDELPHYRYSYSYLENVKDYTLQELADELEGHQAIDGYTNTLDDCNVIYTTPYDIISICGYSQGDYAEVIIPTAALEGALGVEVNLNDLKTYIAHLFYDAPLCCIITINNHEYYDSDFWEDPYIYDKDDFIQAFMAHAKNIPEPEYVREFLGENLPDYPEYLY